MVRKRAGHIRRRAVQVAVATLTALLGYGSAAGQGSGFLSSSPGALARDHAKWDNQDGCNDCHVTNDKAVDSNKCLDCHDHQDLRKRIRAGKGLHSSNKIRGKPCANCHLEHKGRNFDIMAWRAIGGEASFDHNLAGWELRDKHKVLKCDECHKDKNKAGRRTYLGEDKLCGSCHKDDHPHAFDRRTLMRCERCHSEVSWRPTLRRLDFDHNDKRDAEFPQEGTHKDVACAKCHPGAKFNLRQSKPGNCGNSGCHPSDHKDHLFDKKSCDWCHSPRFRSLAQYEFNHKARTRFDLEGKHSRIDCYKCHTKKIGTKKPTPGCERCHDKDNPHRDRFDKFGKPPKCDTCHPQTAFVPNRFSHGRRTGFALSGKHSSTKCRSCHRGKRPDQFERLEDMRRGRACMSCHQHENVHNQEYTDQPKSQKVVRNGERVKTCLECHKEGGSVTITKQAVGDVHGRRGRWPLNDGHKAVKCDKCHVDNDFVDTPAQCGVRCHEDSLHEGGLGDECDSCHAPGIWEATRFDHTSDTDWPLLGLHKKVPTCDDCHPGRRYAKTPTRCADVGCHAKDDAHNGKLGDGCENCHLETGEGIFDHNAQSEFVLDGAHLTTSCADCHPSIEFKPRPKDCYGGGDCHPEPDVHKGQFGTRCESCHNTFSFKQIEPLHDVGSFSLRASHNQIPCQQCHVNNRPLAGTGNFCINCHRVDDVHSNSLSPRCGDCHTQWSFVPATFDHSTVGCNLTGLHRTLPCYDCHKTGNFGGLVAKCYSCHNDIAEQVDADHQGYFECASCHAPNYWHPNFAAGSGYGRESVCR